MHACSRAGALAGGTQEQLAAAQVRGNPPNTVLERADGAEVVAAVADHQVIIISHINAVRLKGIAGLKADPGRIGCDD